MNDAGTPAKQPPELLLRIVTGAAMIAVALVAVNLGGVAFWLLATLAGLVMMAEWAGLHGAPARDKRLALYALFVPLALMFPPPLGAGPGFLALGLLAGAAFFIVIVTNRRELALGVVYIGLPILALLLIRRQHAVGPDLATWPGLIFTLWALSLVWATDIGAYAAGRLIGGPKLAPRLSPNKTWAGLIGGVACASLLGVWLHYQYGLPRRLTLATPILAVIAQGGDLYESWLKRRAGVKDSGNLIPGHGGVLDRLDGLVPVAPVAALLVVLPHFYPLMRTVTILGATGSVGTSTLDLVEREPDRFRVRALTANCDVERLAAAAIRTRAELAVVADEGCLPALRDALRGSNVVAAGGRQAVIDAAAGADWTMAAIVGCAGLEPVLAAIRAGGTVVLANKEPLVSAGELILAAAKASGATLLPADSEHNAIHQCFDFDRPERVRRIILTGSGGPFRDWSLDAMRDVTPAQAVAHPNWSMGAKISVDSATMFNKGLELIEAARLFPVAHEQIEIVVHRQSVIHSMVDYVDGSMLAQLGPSDMRVPIAHTLAWPDRMATPMPPLDLVALGRLDFEAPDPARFPALRLAREALVAGGSRPAILNAANEVAVAAFLAGGIGFLEIAAIVEDTLGRYDPAVPADVDAVLAIDAEARRLAGERVKESVA